MDLGHGERAGLTVGVVAGSEKDGERLAHPVGLEVLALVSLQRYDVGLVQAHEGAVHRPAPARADS
jgi:hypothetical protein